MSNGDKIYVTRPFLPPLEEFIPYLEQIWETEMADQRRTVSPATRAGPGRLSGRRAHRPVHQRHDRPGHGAAGAAHHRRSDHDAVLLRGDRPTLCSGTGSSRCSSTSSRRRATSTRHDRGGHHAADDRHHAGALLRDALRRRGHPGDRRQLRPARSSTTPPTPSACDAREGASSGTATCRCSASTPPRCSTPSRAAPSSARTPRPSSASTTSRTSAIRAK